MWYCSVSKLLRQWWLFLVITVEIQCLCWGPSFSKCALHCPDSKWSKRYGQRYFVPLDCMIINIMSEGCRSPLTIYKGRRTINFSHMYKSGPVSACNVMRNSWKRRYAAPVTYSSLCYSMLFCWRNLGIRVHWFRELAEPNTAIVACSWCLVTSGDCHKLQA